MKIVVDENMPFVEGLFSSFAQIVALPGRSMTAADVQDADVLLVRSITQVNEQLLKDSNVRFVGSATIGVDHLDTSWLTKQGIEWCSAPGCNAMAVADYVISCLYNLSKQHGQSLKERTFGVVGVGNVGRRVFQRLEKLGFTVFLCDPFVEQKMPDSGYLSLDELLDKADVVCLHTPLTCEGEYPTYHLLNRQRLAKLKPGTWLLNAGRGPVIDGAALLDCLSGENADLSVVLDVWESEPRIDARLAHLVDIATPHIAGYSLDGKARGTYMLYQSLCEWLGYEASVPFSSLLPKVEVDVQVLESLSEPLSLINYIYSPYGDDQRLRETLLLDRQPEAFDQLRKNYPVRREFGTSTVNMSEALSRSLGDDFVGELQSIGFNITQGH